MPTITLPSRCDRAAAEAVLPSMIASLGSGPLQIDARECTQIGQAMLQLLVSARRSQGGATILPSPVLQDIARLAGLEADLFDGGAA
ncbi:STAS domain-containing protein [Novosphingobium sp. NBM11]|jgi:hypothetical protein|uniref:STAS domain-containing protein n=1 Tax=unclassified Novosphingobium TaxID=2644732 RepID=UPI00189280CB|nr:MULTISPECIES: STAS domain-containing protein [unclassified Novosphingobium]MBF5091461.1 STAS domain-containing protein [Novosphingobium sp. NBM11]